MLAELTQRADVLEDLRLLHVRQCYEFFQERGVDQERHVRALNVEAQPSQALPSGEANDALEQVELRGRRGPGPNRPANKTTPDFR